MSKQYPSTMIRFSSITVPSHIQCPAEAVSEMAKAIIATDGVLVCPVVVERTELQTFSLRRGHLEYYAWQKAVAILSNEGKAHELDSIPAWVIETPNIIEVEKRPKQDKASLLKQVALHEAEAVRNVGGKGQEIGDIVPLDAVLMTLRAHVEGGIADAQQVEHLMEAYSHIRMFQKSMQSKPG